MQYTLLHEADEPRGDTAYDPALSQFMTPAWAAEAIVAHALPDITAGSVVIEPSCGIGRFLDALPAGIRSVGVEIDARLAEIARTAGHEVVVGDFRTVDLPVDRCDVVLGNPPFDLGVLDGMLERSHALLEDGGRVVMILPSFAFQTTSRVVRYNARWSLSQEMLPRNLFPGLRLPLVLAGFTRDPKPRLTGFLLYHESREIEEMPEVYRRALAQGRSGWRAVIEAALRRLGGEADVSEIYREIEPRRPTATRHWREQVRKHLNADFRRTARGRYAVAA